MSGLAHKIYWYLFKIFCFEFLNIKWNYVVKYGLLSNLLGMKNIDNKIIYKENFQKDIH